jgi:hypothetical protein
MSKGAASSSGVGVGGLLGVLFVALKLTGHISWSWWWVTTPFWGWLVLLALIFVCAFAYYWIDDVLDSRRRRKGVR